MGSSPIYIDYGLSSPSLACPGRAFCSKKGVHGLPKASEMGPWLKLLCVYICFLLWVHRMPGIRNGMSLHIRHQYWMLEGRYFDRRGEELHSDDAVIVIGYRDELWFSYMSYVDAIDYASGHTSPGVVMVLLFSDDYAAAQHLMCFRADSWLCRRLRTVVRIWRRR